MTTLPAGTTLITADILGVPPNSATRRRTPRLGHHDGQTGYDLAAR